LFVYVGFPFSQCQDLSFKTKYIKMQIRGRDYMDAKLNKNIILLLADELGDTFIRAGKSIREIINTIATSHPEITFSEEEWNQLNEETRAAIIKRVRKTLASVS
jgi:hypothetical protein